ncbi:hypothetical protein COCNU_07G000170 [Cocos nucifera]|uniref:Uncharacterized protein n=1 Tax=Cocos nucifera TaxID=13894 RepID=A0A8K0IDH0_COCNU|nr:hypothetical protein COCNU_07G000170 [Cocos nucifera]
MNDSDLLPFHPPILDLRQVSNIHWTGWVKLEHSNGWLDFVVDGLLPILSYYRPLTQQSGHDLKIGLGFDRLLTSVAQR